MPAAEVRPRLRPWLRRRVASRRLEVRDRSMEPTLLPGDRIRVDLSAYRRRPPSLGEIVVVVDPEAPDRWLVKRVGAVREDGAHGTFLTLVSDNPGMGRDSRSFGEVAAALLVGRAYYRYGPVERRGPL